MRDLISSVQWIKFWKLVIWFSIIILTIAFIFDEPNIWYIITPTVIGLWALILLLHIMFVIIKNRKNKRKVK